MEGTIGEIRLFGGSWPPQGWAFCNGYKMTIDNYHAPLYSVIGTNFGGDGVHDFYLPKLQSLGDYGPHYIICIQGTYPARP